jgi:two-component system, cell cycle sensor histidine kinase and response regulator CckA
MRIRPRVILSIIILCIITLVIAVALYMTLLRTNELNAREDTAESLLLKSHQLSELSNDYILFHEKRQQVQWETKYNSITSTLAQLRVDRPAEQNLVDNFASNHKRLKEIFNEVRGFFETDSGSMKDGGDIGFLRVSWSRLAVQAQGMIHDASQLALLIQTETRNIHQRIIVLIMTMIGTLIIFIVLNYFFINWKLLRSVENLRKGTMIIGEGNLDYRIDDTAKDEIGDLARSFNHMSVNLINVMASKEELNREVEERKRAEDALERARNQAQMYLDIAGVMLVALNAQGNITMMNRRGREILGYREDEIIGKNWFDVCLPAELRGEVKSVFEKLMAGEIASVEYYENPVFTKDGEQRILEFHNTVLHDESGRIVGIFSSGEDATERKKAEEDLKSSETRYRQLADVTFEGIIFHDEGVLLQANDQFFQMFGYEPDELVGTQIIEKTLTLDSLKTVRAKIAERSTESYVAMGLRKDGTTFPIEIRARIREVEGKQIRATAIRDLSMLKNLEAQLLQAQKMEAIGTLAGGIAHDFNNLLQTVLGYAEFMLQRKKQGETDYNDLQKIYQAGERGAALVKSLMTFSRKIETKHVPVDLNQEITSFRDLLFRTIPKTINIDLHLKGNLELIKADRSQIGQVLMNLGVNSRDAMPDGGTLTIGTANIQLDEEYCSSYIETKPGRYVLLTVSDTGQGMDKETLSHMFEPFYSTKETGKGTGLGLATVYGIVKQHSGHITCYSELGMGTTFKIYFPAIEQAEDAETRTNDGPIRGGTETILLVDDDDEIKDLGATLLNSFGYAVVRAGNGKEALEIYQRDRESISLVILDLIMPVMDGRQCLAEILRIDPHAKVIIASGYSEGGPANGVMAARAKGFVQKPYSMRELLTTIREILDVDILGHDNAGDRRKTVL